MYISQLRRCKADKPLSSRHRVKLHRIVDAEPWQYCLKHFDHSVVQTKSEEADY